MEGKIKDSEEDFRDDMVTFENKLKNYFKDNDEIKRLYKFDRNDSAKAILEYIGGNDQFVSYLDKKDAGIQREMLYERTLKQRFPNLQIERSNDGEILINLETVDKKE